MNKTDKTVLILALSLLGVFLMVGNLVFSGFGLNGDIQVSKINKVQISKILPEVKDYVLEGNGSYHAQAIRQILYKANSIRSLNVYNRNGASTLQPIIDGLKIEKIDNIKNQKFANAMIAILQKYENSKFEKSGSVILDENSEGNQQQQSQETPKKKFASIKNTETDATKFNESLDQRKIRTAIGKSLDFFGNFVRTILFTKSKWTEIKDLELNPMDWSMYIPAETQDKKVPEFLEWINYNDLKKDIKWVDPKTTKEILKNLNSGDTFHLGDNSHEWLDSLENVLTFSKNFKKISIKKFADEDIENIKKAIHSVNSQKVDWSKYSEGTGLKIPEIFGEVSTMGEQAVEKFDKMAKKFGTAKFDKWPGLKGKTNAKEVIEELANEDKETVKLGETLMQKFEQVLDKQNQESFVKVRQSVEIAQTRLNGKLVNSTLSKNLNKKKAEESKILDKKKKAESEQNTTQKLTKKNEKLVLEADQAKQSADKKVSEATRKAEEAKQSAEQKDASATDEDSMKIAKQAKIDAKAKDLAVKEAIKQQQAAGKKALDANKKANEAQVLQAKKHDEVMKISEELKKKSQEKETANKELENKKQLYKSIEKVIEAGGSSENTLGDANKPTILLEEKLAQKDLERIKFLNNFERSIILSESLSNMDQDFQTRIERLIVLWAVNAL